MKQLEIIKRLTSIFQKTNDLQAALLYGSFGRGEGIPNSDIDIQILVDANFKTQVLIDALKSEFKTEFQYISEVTLRNKIVMFFNDLPKVELGICQTLDEINRNYLGSEITNVTNTILYAKNNWKERIEKYLHVIVEKYNAKKNTEKTVLELVDKFVYEFENCSTMHSRSDGFQFYFFYNIALHIAVQLNSLAKGETKYLFLPKQFIANTLTDNEQKSFYELKGTLFLQEANHQKRKLLEFFYNSIQTLVNHEKQKELTQFLEWIYERDFFWNFRDISRNNPKIKSGVIYRTATLTLFQNENRFEDLIQRKRINTVIDFRADREIDEHAYSEEAKLKFNYVRTPFDPWNQPNWFKEQHHFGTNDDIAYRFFILCCKHEIKNAIAAIINEKNATAIHCFAGKDRTGIFISLLHLLVETPLDVIFTDYLASESDVKPHRLEMVLNIINEHGGIVSYLIDCGLQQEQIECLKNKLLYGS